MTDPVPRWPRTGVGIDVHRLVAGRPLVVGGVTIPSDRGLDGHSDADVLLHAVTDAILGALSLGNIGTHFPNTDPRWKDAASEVFVRRAVSLARERGYAVGNVDATVVAEAPPRLMPHAPAMRERMSGLLEVPVSEVSVKATTAEGLGALGRGEGMSCVAVVTLIPGEAR
jgi:2-C-methyl-D-erythritol 2,4-cyclodiphosphate synthase